VKRAGNLIDAIADWQNLRLAAVEALRGKRSKADARLYLAGLDADLRRLGEQIRAGSMPVGRFHQFTIYDPKERRITAPCFEERVLHHAIMNLCEPVLTSQHFANSYLGWCDRFLKEQRRIPGYVRYMDDMALWSDSTAELSSTLQAVQAFLADRLQLTVKPHPYLNRTGRGMDFLGCRVFPTHQRLNARSRRRFRRKLAALERALQQGRITEREAQQRSEALVAFTRTPGVKSWCFRRRAVEQITGEGQGLGARAPRRQLEQQRQELPVRLPQQERAEQPEPELRVPPGRSSNGD
jgi:hypothetical protein